MPPRKALPGKDTGITRPMDRALDTLTDPDIKGTPGVQGSRGIQENSSTSVFQDVSGTYGTRGTVQRARPALRDHVKLRRDLADEVRDAVWFLSEHGRPRVQLGELLDEAIEAWLSDAKKQHNGGHTFPHRGRLR